MQTEPHWPKGNHPDYSGFVIEVGVRKDQSGTVRSYKNIQGAQDLEVAHSMGPSQGMEEGAWALLTESVRIEAMLQILVKLSNDPEFKEKMAAADAAPDDLIEKLSQDTLEQIKRSLVEMVPGIAREAVEQVHDGLRR